VLFASVTYNPAADFAPVSLVGNYPILVVVSKDSKLKTLQEYIAAAKAEPGKVTYATPGIGSVPYLTAELFKIKAGVNLTHVPYRGVAAGAMTDLITNRIDSMFNTTGSLLQSVRSGQTIALAASTPKRSPLAQEIPTFAESGVPGFDVTGWYAVFVPAKTPADIVSKMHEGMAKALSDSAVKQKFEILGVEAASSTPDQLTGLSKIEFDLWSPIIKANNIKGE
jgi:tripartite-type tricarboxylate transporter receptor subunit TctC